MTAPHIDDTTHGNIRWFHGNGPIPVQPYTGDCQHWGQTVIAWGWDEKHYEFVTCDLHTNGQPGCGSRAWTSPQGAATTPWMQPIIEANRQAIDHELANPLTFNKGGNVTEQEHHHHHLELDVHKGWKCVNCGEEFPLDYRGGEL